MKLIFDFGEDDLSTGDTLQVKLGFLVQAVGSDITIQAEDYSLTITDYGKLEWKSNIEDYFLVPGIVEMSFGDPSLILWDALFKGSLSEVYDFTVSYKRPTIWIYFNGELEYEGVAIEDAIGYDKGKRETTISFSVGTEVLNELYLYDNEDPPATLNPLGYGTGQLCQYASVPTCFSVSVTGMIERIFRKVLDQASDPMDIDILQNWIFKGYQVYGDSSWKEDFTFNDIKVFAGRYFFTSDNGLNSVGDVLRILALEWGCLAGVLSKHKAFFRQMFYYDPTNEQTLGSVLNQEPEFKIITIDYTKFNCNMDPQQTGGTDNSQHEGTYAGLDYKKIDKDIIACFFGDPDHSDDQSSIEADHGGNVYKITRCQDSNIPLTSGWSDHVTLLVALWHTYRHDYDFCRIDHFEVEGLGYDFTKCFTYDGIKYYTLGLSKLWAKGVSEIDALYLGVA